MEIVDQRTGEITETSEYLTNLRNLEELIAASDEKITRLKDELKAAREVRERAVEQLRAGVRDGQVLPLFEVVDR